MAILTIVQNNELNSFLGISYFLNFENIKPFYPNKINDSAYVNNLIDLFPTSLDLIYFRDINRVFTKEIKIGIETKKKNDIIKSLNKNEAEIKKGQLKCISNIKEYFSNSSNISANSTYYYSPYKLQLYIISVENMQEPNLQIFVNILNATEYPSQFYNGHYIRYD